MASRPSWCRPFKDDSQLQQYFLEDVVPTGKTLGVGSYGSVVEVKYSNASCAAKRMHELLLDPGNEGVRDTVDRYRRECQLMASLRHPNITQFLGLCFLEGSELPLLVMEKLEMSIDDLLECSPNIPLQVKISILTDTSSGLVYLHSQTPPIIHSDLTARNVLLTASLAAKISDMGNSQIVTLRPSQLAETFSKNPGTTVYMPPEAFSESHIYGPSLDVFSFGHLALYAFTQVFPGELLIATRADPKNPGRLLSRSEVERREVYMKKLESQSLESHHILVELVTNCLHNNPQARPSAEQLLKTLQVIQKVEQNYGENIERLLNITYVMHNKDNKQMNKRIEDLEMSEGKLEADITELKSNRTILETEHQHLKEENSNRETVINSVQAENSQLKTENIHLKKDSYQLKTEIDRLNRCNVQLAAEKLQLESYYTAEKLQLEFRYQEEKQALLLEVEKFKRKQLNSALGSGGIISHENKYLIFPVQEDWKRGPDMPIAMGGYIQSVETNNTIYVGGGESDRNDDNYIVMAYSTQSCQWHSLPPYNSMWFAMTTINSKLVLVGGQARDNSDSSELGEWQPDSNQWTCPFPPMSTPRSWPSATSYKHWLVVAGGCYGDYLHTRVVEILDVSNMQWFTGPSTPIPWAGMKSTTLEDIWYLMGGYCDDVRWGPDVYSVSLEALVSQSASDSSNIWRKLPSLDCRRSCPLIIGGSLLAVGGRDMRSKKPVFAIQCYIPETYTLVQAGLLPHAIYNCTCIMISDRLHVVGGYDGKTRHKELFSFTIYHNF